MGIEVSYELDLTPVEDSEGVWDVLIYRNVRAGICGPFSEQVRVQAAPGFYEPLRDLAGRALAALRAEQDYEIGEPMAHTCFGRVSVMVPLTRVERPHLLPVIAESGAVAWVRA